MSNELKAPFGEGRAIVTMTDHDQLVQVTPAGRVILIDADEWPGGAPDACSIVLDPERSQYHAFRRSEKIPDTWVVVGVVLPAKRSSSSRWEIVTAKSLRGSVGVRACRE